VAVIATGAIYIQLILGATVRHTGAALAIPDFPLAFGGLVPPLETAPVVIHFAHRMFALVVVGATGWLVSRIWREYSSDPRFTRPAIVLSCLAVVQVLIGGTIVWTSRAVFPATAHVATGALLLATSWLLTLRAFRHLTPVAAPSMSSMSVAENRGLS
jgi:cytochrome c oxidase assembly protein subunit 15